MLAPGAASVLPGGAASVLPGGAASASTGGAASVLIVRLGAVGDVVRALPLLQAMRAHAPRRRIGWLVEEASAPLLRAVPGLDAVHVLPRRTLEKALKRLALREARRAFLDWSGDVRGHRYDVALDVHGTLKAALAARLSGAREVVGFAPGGSKEGAQHLHDRSHPFPAEPMTRVRRALFLGACAGMLGDDPAGWLEDDPRVDFGLRFPPTRTAAIAPFAQCRRPLVVLYPFASAAGQSKRWPIERHVELGLSLSDRARIVLAWGSPREREEAERSLGSAGATLELSPATDLVELTFLLQHADLVVTGDTGPMHLAAGVGTRVLALFGPSDPVINRPWGPGHRVLHRIPLSGLTVEEVRAEALALLSP